MTRFPSLRPDRPSWSPHLRAGLAPFLFLLTACATPGTLSAAEPAAAPEPATVTASASASVPGRPDRFLVQLAVVTADTDAQQALDGNSARVRAVREAIRAAGVPADDVRTGQLSISPQWAPRPRNAGEAWTPRIAGFEVRNRVVVDTDRLDVVGALVGAAAEAGANEISGLRFALSETGPLRREAIERATARARQEAEAAARALGRRLGPVRRVTVDPERSGGPSPMVRMAAMDAAESVPIEAGTLEISASVRLEVELAPQ